MPFVGLDPELATRLAIEMRTAAAGADEQSAVTRQALALAELSSSVPTDLLEVSEDLTIASDVVTASADVVANYELDPGTEAAIARGLWMLALGQAAGELDEADLTDVDAALANFSFLYRLPEPTSITGLILGIPTTDPAVVALVARLDTWLFPLLSGDWRGFQEVAEQQEEDLRLLLKLLGIEEGDAMVREEDGDRVDIFFSANEAIQLLSDRVEADRRFFEYGLLPDLEDILPKDYDPDDATDLDWLPAALAGRAEVPIELTAVLQLLKLAGRNGMRLGERFGHKITKKDLRGESPEVLARLAEEAMTHLRDENLLPGTVREGTELQIFSAAAIAAQIRYGGARGAISDAAVANSSERADTAFGIPPGAIVPGEMMAGPPVLIDQEAFNAAVTAEVGRISDSAPSANQLTASYNWVHQAATLAEQRQRMLDVLLSWRSHTLVGPALMSASEQRAALAEFHPDLPKELKRFLDDPKRLNKVVKRLGVGGYHEIKLTDAYRLHLSNDDLGRVAQVQMEHRQSAGWGYVMTGLGVAGVFFPPAAVVGGAMQAMQAAANDDWLGAGIAALGAFAGAASVASAASAASAAAATTAGAASAAAASAANAATVSQIAYAAQGAAIAGRAIDAGDTVGAITAGASAFASGLGAGGFDPTSAAINAGIATVNTGRAIDDGDLLMAVGQAASAIGQFGSIAGLGAGSLTLNTLEQVRKISQVARGIRDEDPVLIASALREDIVALAGAARDFVARTVDDLNVFARNEPESVARIDQLSELPPDQLAAEKGTLEAQRTPLDDRLAEVRNRLDTPIDSEERRALTRERDYLQDQITGIDTAIHELTTAQGNQELRKLFEQGSIRNASYQDDQVPIPSLRPQLTPEEIVRLYQVPADSNGTIKIAGWTLSVSEFATLVQGTAATKGQFIFAMRAIESRAADTAREYFGGRSDDSHQNAFKHAYWNAMLVRTFGEEFARDFTNLHESIPGNRPDREAMDLFNNQRGREIAINNPTASREELIGLIVTEVVHGRLAVIDAAGDLQYSDDVEIGNTGTPDDPPPEPENIIFDLSTNRITSAVIGAATSLVNGVTATIDESTNSTPPTTSAHDDETLVREVVN